MSAAVGMDTPLVRVVGDKTAESLRRLELHTVGDLLHHFPRRYVTRGELTRLADLRIGEHVTVMAEIRSVHGRKMQQRRGNILEVVVTDGSGELSLTFFNQSWRDRHLVVGARGLFAGQVSVFKGKRQLTHPECHLLDTQVGSTEAEVAAHLSALIPIYSSAAKLPSWKIANSVGDRARGARRAGGPAARRRTPPARPHGTRRGAEDHPPAAVLASADPGHHPAEVGRGVHAAGHPRPPAGSRHARSPLCPGEPCRAACSTRSTPALPFTLTDGQRAVGAEDRASTSRPCTPCTGCCRARWAPGKTLVATRAMLQVVDGGGQAALLAPTEVLAEQRARSTPPARAVGDRRRSSAPPSSPPGWPW